MNLYDFDETIYDSDSTRDFVLYLYRHYPATWRYLPRQLAAFIGYMSGRLTKTAFKEKYFSMFAAVPDIETVVESFWDLHEHKLCSYYPPQAHHDDVVISASPRFIVAPLCRRLGIRHVIASEVNPQTGQFDGENCYGEEKVRRFLAAGFDPSEVEAVYSDSMSDTPMAKLGQEAYIVTKKGLTDWKPPKQKGMQAFFTLFNKREALMTLALGAAHLLTAGHAAKIFVRDKGCAPQATFGVMLGLNIASVTALLAWLGRRGGKSKRVARAFVTVALPLAVLGVAAVGGLAALGIGGVAALGVVTVASLPLFYKGTQCVFRKEIAAQQARFGTLDEGSEEA